MVPLEPEALPDLWGVRVIVAAGEMDHMVPKENTERLVELLRDSGAEIQVRWQPTGHGLMREEVEEAKRWLDRKSTRLNSSHANISYAVFCLKKKKKKQIEWHK